MGYRSHAGKRRKVEKPVINNLVFLRAEKTRACAAANGLVPMFLMTDSVSRSLLVIPDKQMDDFKRVMDLDPEAIAQEQMENQARQPGAA